MGPIRPRTGYFDARSVIMIVCSILLRYNALELILLIFATFKHWHGLYFWSLLVVTFGIIPYNLFEGSSSDSSMQVIPLEQWASGPCNLCRESRNFSYCLEILSCGQPKTHG